MKVFSPAETHAALPWPELIESLRMGFIEGCEAPIRHHHSFDIPDEKSGTLLLMPAWQTGGYLGIKQVMVIPENGKRGLPAVAASYLLFSAVDGTAIAMLDGEALTHRRTAAASALAAKYLARPDSRRMVMVGTGGLAPNLIQAHAAALALSNIQVWGRSADKAEQLATEMRELGLQCEATANLAEACQSADLISCATLSTEPLVMGEHIPLGCHLDLVGAFTPQMRECDNLAIEQASVFVDTRAGALAEAGDILQAIEAGTFAADQVCADLNELCAGTHMGRQGVEERTVFKSVGTALEDLIAAKLAFEKTSMY